MEQAEQITGSKENPKSVSAADVSVDQEIQTSSRPVSKHDIIFDELKKYGFKQMNSVAEGLDNYDQELCKELLTTSVERGITKHTIFEIKIFNSSLAVVFAFKDKVLDHYFGLYNCLGEPVSFDATNYTSILFKRMIYGGYSNSSTQIVTRIVRGWFEFIEEFLIDPEEKSYDSFVLHCCYSANESLSIEDKKPYKYIISKKESKDRLTINRNNRGKLIASHGSAKGDTASKDVGVYNCQNIYELIVNWFNPEIVFLSKSEAAKKVLRKKSPARKIATKALKPKAVAKKSPTEASNSVSIMAEDEQMITGFIPKDIQNNGFPDPNQPSPPRQAQGKDYFTLEQFSAPHQNTPKKTIDVFSDIGYYRTHLAQHQYDPSVLESAMQYSDQNKLLELIETKIQLNNSVETKDYWYKVLTQAGVGIRIIDLGINVNGQPYKQKHYTAFIHQDKNISIRVMLVNDDSEKEFSIALAKSLNLTPLLVLNEDKPDGFKTAGRIIEAFSHLKPNDQEIILQTALQSLFTVDPISANHIPGYYSKVFTSMGLLQNNEDLRKICKIYHCSVREDKFINEQDLALNVQKQYFEAIEKMLEVFHVKESEYNEITTVQLKTKVYTAKSRTRDQALKGAFHRFFVYKGTVGSYIAETAFNYMLNPIRTSQELSKACNNLGVTPIEERLAECGYDSSAFRQRYLKMVETLIEKFSY